jgi:hypothetical protein
MIEKLNLCLQIKKAARKICGQLDQNVLAFSGYESGGKDAFGLNK